MKTGTKLFDSGFHQEDILYVAECINDVPDLFDLYEKKPYVINMPHIYKEANPQEEEQS